MRDWTAISLLVVLVTLTLTGCDAADSHQAIGDQSHVGWYMQRAGQGLFQSCGQERQVRITDPADLDERARKFGLQPDTPVYVRLRGTQSAGGDALAVSRVEQFGSDKPVRDCGMTGVVTGAPATSGR